MSQREWVAAAIPQGEADFNRSADTHLIPLALPGFEGIDVYLDSRAIPPAASSTGWRARCSCMRWPMAGCAKGDR